MNHLLILPECTYAGHCESGSSNKDWVACLAVEVDEQVTTPPPIVGDTDEVVYLSVFGPHGASLRLVPPKRLAMGAARKLFRQKCNEKDGEGYVRVDFAQFLLAFGSPLGLTLTAPAAVLGAGGVSAPSTSRAASTGPALAYAPQVVKAMSWEKLQLLLADPNYGVTEKVNGERCFIRFDGKELVAYNRKGQRLSTPPEGAEHLRQLGRPFVTDGEWMTRDLPGFYVAFALIEWDTEPCIARSYETTITTLERAMFAVGLIKEACSIPTLAQALANSTVPNLALLVAAAGAERKQRVLEAVRAGGGEGVVVRRLFGDYREGPRKYKFVADLDAFVLGVNTGLAGGSLKLGVVRRADGAIIEVANVRAGFTDGDIAAVQEMLGQGKRPVFTVTFLPARTVGVLLVEPRSGMTLLRSDKEPAECTDEQYEPEKADLIAQASAVASITL